MLKKKKMQIKEQVIITQLKKKIPGLLADYGITEEMLLWCKLSSEVPHCIL